MSNTSFIYNGKVQKPQIQTIKGAAAAEGTDYTSEWSEKSSKNVGSYRLTITGKGDYTEYFEAGTVPTDYCDVHELAYVCSVTGLLANGYCPGYYQACIIRPDDIKGGPARGYTLDSNYAFPYGYCTYHTGVPVVEETDEGTGLEDNGYDAGGPEPPMDNFNFEEDW